MVASKQDDNHLMSWLSNRLHLERFTLLTSLEEKHSSLLSEMQQMFGLPPPDHADHGATGDCESLSRSHEQPKLEFGPAAPKSKFFEEPSQAEKNQCWANAAARGGVCQQERNQVEDQQTIKVPLPNSPAEAKEDFREDNVSPHAEDGVSSKATATRKRSRKCADIHAVDEAHEATWPDFEPDEVKRRVPSQMMQQLKRVTVHFKDESLENDEQWTWSWYSKFTKVVRTHAFEATFASAILVNAILMTFDLQREGLQIGFELGFPTYDRSAEDAWPGAKKFFEISERVFSVIFFIELTMRVCAYRLTCFNSIWNWIDAVVVVLVFIPWIWEANMGMNPTVVRLARFGKLMKIVRLMRTTTFMASLKLLVTSILASVNTLFWSLCVLLVIQMFFGLLICYLLLDFLLDPSNDSEVQLKVFAYFGTYWRSIVTMFEIIFANWGPICRLLLDNVTEYAGIFFLLYRCIIGFAILAVIQAVFIQQTMKSAAHDDQLCLEEKNREKAKFLQRLQRVFRELDKNADGVISWEEFEPLMSDERLQGLMHTLEVSPQDVEGLFQELDDGDGEISTEEFLKGVSGLRGSAKSMDVVKVLNVVRRVEAKLDTVAIESHGDEKRYEHAWKHNRSATNTVLFNRQNRPMDGAADVESSRRMEAQQKEVQSRP